MRNYLRDYQASQNVVIPCGIFITTNLPRAEYWRAHACAPQVRGGWELAAIRKNLINRAVRLGYFHAREGHAA